MLLSPTNVVASLTDKVAAALEALQRVQPVQTLLRCVASLIGRAILDERLLTSLLMQNLVGALANLAQHEQVCTCAGGGGDVTPCGVAWRGVVWLCGVDRVCRVSVCP
jgi:hypothetical protein